MCNPQTFKQTYITKKTLKMKRRLPNRFAISARVNLNKFWMELEEIYQGRTSSTLLVLPELEDENVEEQNKFNEEREKMESSST